MELREVPRRPRRQRDRALCAAGRARGARGHRRDRGRALTELVTIRVIPRAKRNEVGGERDGRLIVRTTATPVDGKANAAVCKQVAEYLGVPVRQVEIVSGHRSRDKVLRVGTRS